MPITSFAACTGTTWDFFKFSHCSQGLTTKVLLKSGVKYETLKRFPQDFPSVFQHLGIDFISVVKSNQFFKPIDFVSHAIQIIS